MIMQPIPEAAAQQPAESALIVSFRLGSQQYGLPIAVVCEVVRLPALVTLVGAAAALCGLLNLRGLYLPVFDGRVLLGEAADYDLSKLIMIVGRVGPELGLLVDQVHGVGPRGGVSSAALTHPLAGALIDSVCEAAHGSDHGSIICLSPAALLALATEAAPTAPMLVDQQD
jgi:chemotaxis signal transduction protein